MTAPQIPLNETWELAPDGDGEPTLWHAGWAVLRRSDMATPRRYQDALWQVLTAVLAPDEATIERLGRAVTVLLADDEDVVVTLTSREIRAVLRALAGTSAQARHTDGDATGGGEHG